MAILAFGVGLASSFFETKTLVAFTLFYVLLND
jgi:hypothetical protein